ncbi:MAG: lytic transglycosylase domain-containing protein, partial [Candidatus Dadabacteria bacterium]
SGIAEEQRAHFAIGRIREAARQYNAAASEYRKAARGPDVRLAHESGWRAAWVSYLAGNYEGAAWAFGKAAVAAAGDHRLDGGHEAALYWRARSLEKAGKKEKALTYYRSVLSESPDGYYAMLAERRTGLEAPPPVLEALDDPVPADPGLRRALLRARELNRARLREFARREMAATVAAAAPAERRALLPELAALGLHGLALRAALELYRAGILKEGELYSFLYPEAHRKAVGRIARQHGLDPYFVYAVMRQESAFDERAVSSAEAHGLMQLLEPTARRLAQTLGMDAPERTDLFVPELNIRLGVAYLAELARRFGNDKILMLAAYNAGERAAQRWRDRYETHEPDEFIEMISYRETRNYIKKVLRNYRNYRRLYCGNRTSSCESGQEPAGQVAEGTVGHAHDDVPAPQLSR